MPCRQDHLETFIGGSLRRPRTMGRLHSHQVGDAGLRDDGPGFRRHAEALRAVIRTERVARQRWATRAFSWATKHCGHVVNARSAFSLGPHPKRLEGEVPAMRDVPQPARGRCSPPWTPTEMRRDAERDN